MRLLEEACRLAGAASDGHVEAVLEHGEVLGDGAPGRRTEQWQQLVLFVDVDDLGLGSLDEPAAAEGRVRLAERDEPAALGLDDADAVGHGLLAVAVAVVQDRRLRDAPVELVVLHVPGEFLELLERGDSSHGDSLLSGSKFSRSFERRWVILGNTGA